MDPDTRSLQSEGGGHDDSFCFDIQESGKVSCSCDKSDAKVNNDNRSVDEIETIELKERTKEEKRKIASIFEPMLSIQKLHWNGDLKRIWKFGNGQNDNNKISLPLDDYDSDTNESEIRQSDNEEVETMLETDEEAFQNVTRAKAQYDTIKSDINSSNSAIKNKESCHNKKDSETEPVIGDGDKANLQLEAHVSGVNRDEDYITASEEADDITEHVQEHKKDRQDKKQTDSESNVFIIHILR